MRDHHDTQTRDLIPAKRGRPCLDVDQGPMTPAERARRYRANRRTDAKSAKKWAGTVAATLLHEYSDIALLEAIRMERAFLERLLSRKMGNAGATPSRKRLGSLVAELGRRYPA